MMQDNDGTPLAALHLEKQVSPRLALPGQTITFTLGIQNVGTLSVTAGELRDVLPLNLDVLTETVGGAGVYVSDTRELVWSDIQLDGGEAKTYAFQARIAETCPEGPILNQATLKGGGEIQVVTTTLQVGSVTTDTLTPAGGELTSPDGRVRLTVPPGAISETATITLAVYAQGVLPQGTPLETFSNPESALVHFEIQARQGHDPIPLTTLAKPVQLSIDVREDLTHCTWLDNGWYVAYQDAEEATRWHGVDVHVIDPQGWITATTQHFSNWAAGPENAGWRFSWQEPGIAAFSGAATYHYPIELPPGRGGVQPNIDLSYSSRSLDGRTVADVEMNQGEIGLGWTVNSIAILREGVRTVDQFGHVGLEHPDRFTLLFDGQGYELVREGDVSDDVVRYFVVNAPQLYVERRYDPAAADANPDRFYWILKTSDGTTYRLGYTPDAATGQKMISCCSLMHVRGHAGHDDNPSYGYSGIRWMVDTVTDVYGNQIQYQYETWQETDAYDSHTKDGNGNSHRTSSLTHHNRLHVVRYNYEGLARDPRSRVSGPHASQIIFVNSPNNHRIQQIQLFHGDLSQPYNIYDLDIETVWHMQCSQPVKTWVLRSITQRTGDHSVSLPSTTFQYVPLPHTRTGECVYEHLQEVENGYGARVRFTYGLHDDRQPGVLPGIIPAYGRTYLATQKSTWDGVHAQPSVVTYEYATPCYNQYGGDVGSLPGAFNCPTRDNNDGYGHQDLVGFAAVTETIRGYQGEILHQQALRFSQARKTMGRPTWEQVFAIDGTPMQSTQTIYATTDVGPATFSYAQQIWTTDYTAATPISYKTEYRYETFHQDGQQYGQRTHILEYDEDDELQRIRFSRYSANPTHWVIVPHVEATFDGNWDLHAAQFNLYDRNMDPNDQVIDKGALTLIRARLVEPGVSCPRTEPTVDTSYTYDAYGNVETTATYQDYGWVACDSDKDWATWSAPGSGSVAQVMTTTYDTDYHFLPVQVCNPINQCNQMEYYGLNGPSLAKDGAYFGALYRSWGPNGPETARIQKYDAFGRLTHIWRPGDAPDGPPAQLVRYGDVEHPTWHPLMIFTRYKTDAAATYANYHDETMSSWQRTFFDGLGREIQIQTPAEDWTHGGSTGEHDILNHTLYDALGRVRFQSLSYEEPRYVYDPASSPYRSPDAAQPQIETTYDTLGRVIRVTNPDGTHVDTRYEGWSTTSIDANGHQLRYIHDVFQRLVTAEEYKGSYTDPTLYASTVYTYDLLNKLIGVQDTAGNRTSIRYDTLGRKIELNDPDMGTWTYGYNPAGNLTWREDAKDQRLEFAYDALNRVTEENIPANPSAKVTYFYDQGVWGIGHRTAMRYPAGITTYQYDRRGRLITETQAFHDMGAYTTTLEYDTLDRVVTIGYPDGERLTQTYNLRGLPDRLYNDTSEVLVAQTIYNTLKQIESIGLGNGLAMDYEYYTAAQKNNNLKRVHIPGLLDLSYTYDNVGNIGSIHDAVKNQTQHFTYDELDRLTQANTTGTAAGSYNQVCEYDKMGNITTLDDHTYIYSRAHPHAVTQVTHPQGTNQYVYDANGNMTQRLEVSNTQVTTYTQAFDIHNRLVAITMTNSISRAMSRFYYDGDGNRIIKVTDQGTTIYVGEHFEKFLPGQAFTLIPPQSEALTSTPNKTHARYILVKSIQKKFNAGSLYKARISSVFHKARVDIPDHQSPSHINRLMTAPVWSVEGSQENAHLGESVSSAGDVNNDTFPDIIVGMPDYDVVSGSVVLTDAGKVMVYYGTAAGPNPVPSWTLTGTQANAHLGWSVATAGDINGDGYDDVIIGAPDFVGSTGEGAVFVYTGTANGVSPTYDWLVEGVMTTTYRLGLSVNTAGDVNHDGYADVIIGSEGDFNQPYPGRADVFHGSETGLSEVSAWSFNAGQRSVNFGLSVSTAGDINGDTFDDVIVGSATGLVIFPGVIGRFDVFHGTATGLSISPATTVSSSQLLVEFAVSVNRAGDVNQDGYSDVIVGASQSGSSQVEMGQSRIYYGSASGLKASSFWKLSGSQEYAHLGAAVGAAGDVNGDGYDDILVGAPGFTNGQTDEGCVFVFYGGTEGPRSVADWTIESNQAHARFGTAVNTAGHIFEGGNDAIIVGAPDYDGYQPDGGGVFAYVIDETPPILTVTHPISGEIIGSPQLFIRGKAQDHTSGMGTLAIHLLPRDILYLPSLGAHGAFTQPVGHQSLADGLNKLVITATDQALNKTVITQTLHLDVVGPRVTNLVPHGQISQTHPTIAANFDITGTASISLPTVIIEVDGQDVTLSSTLATNGFTYVPQQPLSEGNHNIHIHVADTASHQTQASGHFNVDRSTWVKVTYPLSNSILNTLTTTVQGYAETNATVALTVNGASAGEHQTTDGTFQFNTVNLVTATNYLTLSVTDGLGNSASTSWVVEVSLEHPSAYVTADPPTFSPIGCVDHTTFALEASVPEGEAIAAWHFQVLSHTEVITHRHGLHQPPASIRWDGEGWPEGAYLYTLTVTATNGATTTTPEQVVHIKTTAPAAPTILYPTSGTVTDRWQVWVAGEGEAESTITLLDGGYFTTTLTQTVGMNGQWGGYYPLHGGVNHIWAIASDATCLESPPSNAVTVTQLAHPPLYTVGVTPTTMAAGESVTLWATTRHHNPMEGAPTAHVWAWPPDGTTQSLTRTGVLDGGEVGLWTESWVVPSGQRSGDYPVFFEGLDTDNIRGQGETGLAVRNGVAAPRILGPAARHITNNPNVHLWGTVEEGYLYLNIFEHSDLLTSQALGPVLHWGVPLTLTGEGPHPLHARAQDRFGQLSPASNLVTITLDTLPPTAHVLPLPAWQGQTAFTVRWTGSDATAGVKSYDVQWWRDGMWHVWQQSTSHLSAPFTGEGGHTYAFRVRARDMVGNQSAWSAPVTTTLDTQAPTAHITSTLGKDDVISVVWHAEDAGAGLQACTVEARDSDGPWTPIATECTGQTTYAGEPGRMSRFRITATDNAGNAGAAQSQAGTPRVTKYYYHGGKRVAMRVAHDLYYLHGDHLGSTHLTTDKDGGLVSEQRYLPYGEVRWEAGTSPTDFGFTGQRAEAGTGLIFMHARYYLPAVGRFIQADSVIASPGNPQNLNRYTYVLNNPLRYIDPTGHIAEDPDEQKEAEGILSKLDTLYDVRIRKSWRYEVSGKWNPGNWTIEELRTVLQAVKDLAQAMGGAKAFRHELGGVRIMRVHMRKAGRGMRHQVWLNADSFTRWTVLHELGHAWDAAHSWQLSKQMQREMGAGFRNLLLHRLHRYDPTYWYDPGDGPPPCGVDERFNAKEDFAESVAAWVDPAQGWISAHSASLHGPRWQKWPYKDPTRGYAYTGFREIPRGQFMGSLFATSRAKFYTHPTSSHNYR